MLLHVLLASNIWSIEESMKQKSFVKDIKNTLILGIHVVSRYVYREDGVHSGGPSGK